MLANPVPGLGGEILDDSWDGTAEFVRGTGQSEFFSESIAGVEVVAERLEGGEGTWGGIEEGDMGPVDFVPAEGVEVDVEVGHREGTVRCVGYAVDAEEGAWDGVHEGGD